MGRLRCYCFDQSCRPTAPRIEPDRGVALPIAVARSVGQGAANLRNDVLTIQQALNGVGSGQGGPTVPYAIVRTTPPSTRRDVPVVADACSEQT